MMFLRTESGQISFPAENSGNQHLQQLHKDLREASKRLQLERVSDCHCCHCLKCNELLTYFISHITL